MAEKTYDIASLGMASYRDLQDINNDEGFENESELDLKSITDPPKRTNYRSDEYLENQSNELKELHSQLDKIKP